MTLMHTSHSFSLSFASTVQHAATTTASTAMNRIPSTTHSSLALMNAFLFFAVGPFLQAFQILEIQKSSSTTVFFSTFASPRVGGWVRVVPWVSALCADAGWQPTQCW
jgi:hypothetical protein